MTKRQRQALQEANFDLFAISCLPSAGPPVVDPFVSGIGLLPPQVQLQLMFAEFNQKFFEGRLPEVAVIYSDRMMSTAGSYSPSEKLIRIGRRYHEFFPEELVDTLKHEMIHILFENHDADFKREAMRLGVSVRAKVHPALARPPKYVYVCPGCGREYPRQKRLHNASCGLCSSRGRYDSRFKLCLKRPPDGPQ